MLPPGRASGVKNSAFEFRSRLNIFLKIHMNVIRPGYNLTGLTRGRDGMGIC